MLRLISNRSIKRLLDTLRTWPRMFHPPGSKSLCMRLPSYALQTVFSCFKNVSYPAKSEPVPLLKYFHLAALEARLLSTGTTLTGTNRCIQPEYTGKQENMHIRAGFSLMRTALIRGLSPTAGKRNHVGAAVQVPLQTREPLSALGHSP